MRFKQSQKLYNKNRKEFVEKLLSGKSLTAPLEHPTANDIERGYNEIFSSESILDNEPILDQRNAATTIYRPITKVEIEAALNTSKRNAAAGYDGINLARIRKIPIRKLEVLYNTMVWLGYVPKQLAISRTTLIPKCDSNLKELGNWRPITISSMIIKVCNRILAKRMSVLPLAGSQRGFSEIDGCFANNLSVETIIKDCRKKAKPFIIISLDVQKAFDTVSHHSVERALKRLNLDNKTISYIMANYNNSRTSIQCGPSVVNDIVMRRGVKQGDPLSPLCFNAVLDELIVKLEQLPGVRIGNSKISCLAYADDLLILSENVDEAQIALNECVSFFTARNMSLNIRKCKSLTCDTVPAKKKLFTKTTPVFKINEQFIDPVCPDSFMKYLGLKFTYLGVTKCSIWELNKQIVAVSKAALKPQQKFCILKDYLVPRYVSYFQNFSITQQILKKADRLVRYCVRSILHLNAHCNNAVIHAPKKAGGLGVFNFSQNIPVIIKNRWEKLRNISESLDEVLDLSMDWFGKITQYIKPHLNTKEKIASTNANTLADSFSGGGIGQVGGHRACSEYIDRPPVYWSGEDFVRAIHLRTNLLPCKSIPSNPVPERRCRAGCFKAESVSHILQHCPITHAPRIHRHNYVAKRVAQEARRKGWIVTEEPNIRRADGVLLKPDLLMVKDNTVIVSDIGIHWEGPMPLSVAYSNKVGIYSNPLFVERLQNMYPDKNIYVQPLIVGARGGWCPPNRFLVTRIGMSDACIKDIITTTMRGGCYTHRYFMKYVWRDRRPELR